MKYRKGIAQGQGQITSESIFFRYHDETWEFPTYDVAGYRGCAHYNGMYWEAKVSKLRALAKKNLETSNG